MERTRVNRQRGMSTDKKYGIADGQISDSVKCTPTIELFLNDMKKNNSPINTLKRRIHRAWTINGPPCYWSVVRKSSHLKIYRSLPLKKNKCKKINNNDDDKQNDNLKNSKIDDKMDYKNNMTMNNNKNIDDNAKNIKNEAVKNNIYFNNEIKLMKYEDDNLLSSTKVKEKFIISDNSLSNSLTSSSSSSSNIKNNNTKLFDKLNERKSNIPILRRNSREFEDINSSKESPRRSLIPQRYRGSTDDLRRSYRDDFNLPTLIPKLLSPQRNKDDKLNKKSQKEEKETLNDNDNNFNEISIESNSFVLTENESVKIDTPGEENNAVNKLKTKDEEIIAESKCQESEELNVDKDNNYCELIIEKNDEFEQRKYMKEEFSNTDDTDDAPNRRSSSHLSPEASPLSTRSSRYSPRESESEPTPGLPRKITGGESCISSQRIRDAITRTRRESNSSTRYESSGSESLRLSESGLRDYVDLARKVRLFGNNYYYPRASVESDEPVQRDSATSAGEDDPNDEFLSRNDAARYTSTTSTQGRTILRRRRQFDSQGSRRRGRSHARTYCTDELPHLQITRQASPLRNPGTNQTQDHLLPNPDYRRLVFISSDSSSGREEDDADSSCSGSSYLNGLPRNSHAQNLEDCDWDYFESDTIPLSSTLSNTIRSNDIIKNIKDSKSVWDCCPGRGSNACLACGGSPGRKVLAVPVPIPVPVPYPVPVPASLWNNKDFAAAASSIITTTSSNDGLTLRNISTNAPWFSWHPRFNHPELFCSSIQRGATRVTGSNLDPSIFTFRPDVITLERYEQIYGNKNLTISSNDIEKNQEKDVKEDSESTFKDINKSDECLNKENHLIDETDDKLLENPSNESITADEQSVIIENNTKVSSMSSDCGENDDAEETNDNCDSSSGRSSVASSDLDESSSNHRFSHIFIVNNDDDDDNNNDDDDDNDKEEENENENDSLTINKKNRNKKMQVHDGKFDNSSINNGIILNSIIPLLDEDPVILQCIKPIDNDFKDVEIKDFSNYIDNNIELKSIRNINPNDDDDNILLTNRNNDSELSIEIKSWDSNVMPDSLEVIEETNKLYTINNIIDNNLHTINDTNYSENSLTKNYNELSGVGSSNNSSSSSSSSGDDDNNVKYMENLSSSETRATISDNLLDCKLTFGSSELNDKEFISTGINENTDDEDDDSEDGDEEEDDDDDGVNELDKSMKLSLEDDIEIDKKERIRGKDDGESSSGSSSCNNDNSSRGGKEFDNYSKQVGENLNDNDDGGNDCEVSKNSGENRVLPRRGMPWFRSGSVERRPPTRKENVLPSTSFLNNNKKSNNINSNKQNNNNISNNSIGSSNNKYKSLVMITQSGYQPVNVVTSDTTTLLQPPECETQSSQGLADYYHLALEALAEPHHKRNGQGPRRPLMVKRFNSHQSEQLDNSNQSDDLSSKSSSSSTSSSINNSPSNSSKDKSSSLSSSSSEKSNDKSQLNLNAGDFIDNDNKLKINENINDQSGIIILEEGLADDDSWVEEVSHDEDEQSCNTPTEESSEDDLNNFDDREEELRGYHRQAIDFTLHTIVEESCEESEAEPSLRSGHLKKKRPTSTSELAKYYFFGLGGNNNSINNNSNNNNFNNNSSNSNNNNTGNININNSESNNPLSSREVDSLSETSSVYSEGLESLETDDIPKEKSNSNDFSNSSKLEKYFLSEFLAFDQDRRDSDGSVGSDSEGRPSPEAQRRKRLVRARGTGRSHSSSLDNLLALTQSSQNLTSQNSLQDLSINQDSQDTQSDDSSTETNGTEDGQTIGFGADGQFDTVKRKKKKLRNIGTQSPRINEDINTSNNENEQIIDSENERSKTPQPEINLISASTANVTSTNETDRPTTSYEFNQRNKQQSRDSGFIGSCDDLLQHRKSPDDSKSDGVNKNASNDSRKSIDQLNRNQKEEKIKNESVANSVPPTTSASLSRKDSFNNWSSDEETNLMMSKMRQFFKTMVANSSAQLGHSPILATNSSTSIASAISTTVTTTLSSSSAATTTTATANNNSLSAITTSAAFSSPVPSPRLSSSKSRLYPQNRTKPPQLIYFENELTRLMKTVPGIRDEQVREIVEYLSSEDTWSDSYDSSDYTSSDLEGAASGRRSALQEQISQSCQQIIDKFDINSSEELNSSTPKVEIENTDDNNSGFTQGQGCIGRDTAFVYHKLVQSFTKMTGDNVSSDTNSTPHSSPPLIAKVMHHIGSRLVALMHQVSEGNSNPSHHPTWRRYPQHNRTPSSASTTEDDDSTSDSNHTPVAAHFQLPRSKSHDPLLLINGHPTASTGQEGEERETSDYERFSWRGSFESALMAADSRTKLSLLTCSGDINASTSASALAMAAKRRSAGDLLFSPKSCSREQLDRVRSCGSIGVSGNPIGVTSGGSSSIEEKIWSNRRRSSVPDANTRTLTEEGSVDDDGDDQEEGQNNNKDSTDDEFEYNSESRAKTLPRGMQASNNSTSTTNSLPRLPITNGSPSSSGTVSSLSMHKAHSMYHFLPSQNTNVKSARYRPPGFARNSSSNSNNNSSTSGNSIGPKRAFSAPGLQVVGGSQNPPGNQREVTRSRRREQVISLVPDDGSSLSEASSTPIIGGSRSRSSASSHNIIDIDDVEGSRLHSGLNLNTRASLSSLGARSDSMASIYSGAGEGRWCGSVTVRGEVEFSLQYDYKQLNFQVHISQCKDLAPVDIKRNRSDPYVKVYLLPDKSKSGKRKTKVKKHTLNPVFDETLKFHMNLNNLETRTLWLTVWHSDMFGRNDFLGEVRMPLENKIFDDPTPQWYPLQERTEPFDDPVAYKGEVIVGLKFVPPDPTQLEKERESNYEHRIISKGKKNWNRGSLHVLVKEARNLQTRAKNSGTCDPFCKSYLLPDKGKSGKQKTNVVRRSDGSPIWSHTFVYKDISLQELAERGLELTVWDHDRIGSNEFLGGVRFNLGNGKHYGKSVDWMDATGRELSLWQSMLERPNFWVEGAVTLRPNLHNHSKSNMF